MPMIYTPAHINSEIFERLRSPKYTPSASLRSAAPSEREPGRAVPFNRVLANIRGYGRFSSPLRMAGSIHRGTLPQSRPFGRASSLREGAGNGLYHSTGYSLISGVTGDFHRPYEGRVPFIGRHSLSHALWACQLPQRGSREALPFNRVLAKIRGYGRFSSPLRMAGSIHWGTKTSP